jgi:hypothetical protein
VEPNPDGCLGFSGQHRDLGDRPALEFEQGYDRLIFRRDSLEGPLKLPTGGVAIAGIQTADSLRDLVSKRQQAPIPGPLDPALEGVDDDPIEPGSKRSGVVQPAESSQGRNQGVMVQIVTFVAAAAKLPAEGPRPYVLRFDEAPE